MRYEQQKRFNKLQTDEFYLLDHEQINNNTEFYKFVISGSTRTVYTIKLYTNGKTFCSCPDFLGHAKKTNCVCKHVCFIINKVLKHNNNNQFYDNLTFNTTELETIKTKCLNLNYNLDLTLFNLSLSDKYEDMKKIPDFNKYRDLCTSDECPICYDVFTFPIKKNNFSIRNIGDILGCPTCSNAVHKKCMEKWLTKKASCAYCRSDVWKRYGEFQSGQISVQL